MRLGVVALLHIQRVGPGIVIQTGNVPKLEGKVDRWLSVNRKKSAIFREVLIVPQSHMEGLLDVRDRTAEPQVPFFQGSVDDFKATRFREGHQRVPIFLAGTEPRGKLLRGKELVIRR